jgi:hypothetical protein
VTNAFHLHTSPLATERAKSSTKFRGEFGNSGWMNKLSSARKGAVMFWTYRIFVGVVATLGHRVIRKGEKTDAVDDLSQLA